MQPKSIAPLEIEEGGKETRGLEAINREDHDEGGREQGRSVEGDGREFQEA